jgi:hypothetical protein
VDANEELACGDHAELSVLSHEHNHMYEYQWYRRHVRFTFFGVVWTFLCYRWDGCCCDDDDNSV